MSTAEITERARNQAGAQLASIAEMLERLQSGEEKMRENASEEIQENPLSVEVRSGWCAPGTTLEPAEYRILLCFGGPAVQITGEFDVHNRPASVRLEYQDWFTPWEEYALTPNEQANLETYVEQFCF